MKTILTAVALSVATIVGAGTSDAFSLESPAFRNGTALPNRFALSDVDGAKNISPPLRWKNPPKRTAAFVLTCVDKAPMANDWVHWMVINLPADTRGLKEGASSEGLPEGAVQRDNTFGEEGWGGPKPPKGSGAHPYVFTLYALRAPVKVPDKDYLTEKELARLIEDKTIDRAVLQGYFAR